MQYPVREYILFPVFILFLYLAAGCNVSGNKDRLADRKDSSVAAWNETIPGNFSRQTDIHIDSMELDSFFRSYPAFNEFAPDVRRFYAGRNYACAWFDENGLIEQAHNLINRIRHIHEEGVERPFPYAGRFDSLTGNMERLQGDGSGPDLETELVLTAGYFAFAHIVWGGMDDSVSRSVDWFLPRKQVSYHLYLDSLLKQGSAGAEEPVYRQYELLRSFLRQYRALSDTPWAAIAADRKSYKPGDKSPAIAMIRKRLRLLGDYKADPAANVQDDTDNEYDEVLVDAVKNFQRRHGLTEDGIIGRGCLAEINTSPAERITQILVNMERSRWVPVRVTSDYLIVNIPEFRLHVYENDSLIWSCNVVVGKDVNKTVVFNGEVKYVVFSPYWNVPRSIVRNEILPGIQKNRNYLARHNMEITGQQGGLPVVRQKPGPANSLGLVKFLFPNSYNIYLHDSPAKSLFQAENRAFSHGCIRVSEPGRLANFLLRKDTAWTPDKIHEAMNAGKEKYVTLKETVPVFIAYFTAFVDYRGEINFRRDIYSRDGRMEKMLLEDHN